MTFEPIAVVGRGCALPGALDIATLWDNMRDGRVALAAARPDEWRLPDDWTGLGVAAAIPTIGGFVRGFDEVFDANGFRRSADEIRQCDPAIRWLLHAARAALDEGRGAELLPRTGLILGSLGYPSRTQAAFAEQVWQSRLPVRARVIPEYGHLGQSPRFWSGSPVYSASAALGLGGEVLVLDAACASSLYAIKLACDRLHDRRADLMLAGGLSGADGPQIHFGFAGLGALSPTGTSRPFHRYADGLVPAEGAALVALMRYEDAIRGDHPILGVIRGIGLANDGATGGFLAPARAGQERAMLAAYRAAALDPATVTLLECHATGTQLGDAVELTSAAAIFRDHRDLPFGSVKGNLGHLLTAAGGAALLKVLGAMEAGIRPMSVGCTDIADIPDSAALRLLYDSEPWDGPRRAAISAFGFGGNNAHLIVDGPREPIAPRRATSRVDAQPIAVVAIGARVGAGESAADLTEALLSAPGAHRIESIELRADGLRFPPNDLRAAPAQALVLEAAREAAASTELPGETMVLTGLSCDPRGALGQAGVRHACWAAHYGDGPETAADFAADFAPAQVMGALANIYANRIGAQFDLTGPAFAVTSGATAGPLALREAARALLTGEVDAAMVGAVELSDEVYAAARGSDLAPGDAAVVLVLKRLADARRDGDDVLATLDSDAVPVEPPESDAHAAAGLITVAAAILAIGQRGGGDSATVAMPGGRSSGIRVHAAEHMKVVVAQSDADVRRVRIAAHPEPVRMTPTPLTARMAVAPELLYPEDEAQIRSVPSRVGALASEQYRLATVQHARYVAVAAEAHQRYLAHATRMLRPSSAPAPAEFPRQPIRTPTTFDRAELEYLATGRISKYFGPKFTVQDDDVRQTRMPGPPLLLVDRVTDIDAEPATLGTGSIRTETDIRSGSWYLDHAGQMPPGVLIEAGQADLLLISWLGADLENRGRRVYRLLGCEATFHAPMPRAGTLLDYDIRITGHTEDGARRLFFFESDCRADGKPQLGIRNGQAGFFTDEELASAGGVLWDPADETRDGAADPVVLRCDRSAFTTEQVRAFAAGRSVECFGPAWKLARTHIRTPRIAEGRMLLLDEVTEFDPAAGPWGRGYLRAERAIRPDDWFFEGHFHNDPCMPGTLMFDGCVQAMSFYLAAAGFTADRDGWVFEPVPDRPYSMRCRGQVTPDSRALVYEIFVSSLSAGPHPTVHADVLVSVDGIKALHVRELAVRLAPDWPLIDWETSGPVMTQRTGDPVPFAALAGLRGRSADERAVDVAGLRLDYRSLLAWAWGIPSHALGPAYHRFDSGIARGPRLPGPPYHFMTRVTEVTGPYAGFRTGSSATIEYDVPAEVWYLTENPAGVMPLSVLMEVLLQPCGWLGSYVGSVLRSDTETFIRNLDGDITVHTEVRPEAERITTRVELLSISELNGMIIESFRIESRVDGMPLVTGTTVFGYFTAEALADQVGIRPSADDRAELMRPCEFRSAARRPGMPGPMLTMIDSITGYWPDGGAARLGRVRAEKTVDPSDWFFKAHFFRDPVMPGSLGVEAIAQLTQWFMLERGLGAEQAHPRFEAVALDRPLRWKYRGQVVPADSRVTVEIEVLNIEDSAPSSCTVVVEAWLWVDGRRIYHVPSLAMVRKSGPPSAEEFERLDSTVDTWLGDHRPTYSVPTLPMMSTVARLCAAAERYTRIAAVRIAEVTLARWIPVAPTALLRTHVQATAHGSTVTLAAWRTARRPELSRFEVVTSAEVGTETGARPEPFPALPDAVEVEDPYRTGAMFHGPAFRYLTELRVGGCGATGIVDCGRGSVPSVVLPQGVLDAMTHVTPRAAMDRWTEGATAGYVVYPHCVRDFEIYEQLPDRGSLLVEARFRGWDRDRPMIDLQLVRTGRVLVAMRLVGKLLPLGGLAPLTPERLRAFLRERDPVDGAGLSRTEPDGTTVLRSAIVAAWSSLGGMLEQAYDLPAGMPIAERVVVIAVKEHLSRKLGLHPSAIACAPDTRIYVLGDKRFRLDVVTESDRARVLDRP